MITARQNRELITKSMEALKTCSDPMEKLRFQLLQSGATGMVALRRYGNPNR